MPVPGLYDVPAMNHISRGKSFDDADAYFGNIKQAGKTRGWQESNVLKSLPSDNVKASNVAKIKVVVSTFNSIQNFHISIFQFFD